MTIAPYWEQIRLDQMDREQWEALCDGCAKCCLHKLEDEDTGIVYYTDVACRFLDLQTCRCTAYPSRAELAEDCLMLEPGNQDDFSWLPTTCAYRKLARGEKLPHWHPLVEGNSNSMQAHKRTLAGRAVSEREDLDLESRIVDWPLED